MTIRSARPHSTLRLQLHRGFGFAEALAQCDYFAALGVSHIYASPIFSARSGSTHGYDVVDPQQVNPELGGEPGLRALVQGLHQRGMGLILDIVPNHMAIGSQNPWWCDVLLWGEQSAYANWFDIAWQGPDTALHGKVLLPILGDSYGVLLSAGAFTLDFDGRSGRFSITYGDQHLPLAPQAYAALLAHSDAPCLDEARAIFAALAHGDKPALQQQAQRGWQLLQVAAAQDAGATAIAALLQQLVTAPGAAMHALLECQHYRLCDWRNAGDEINWRRFFEIGDLIGMRVEREDVFEATHSGLFRLVEQGLVDGVRIDHIDGLADPRAYARQLRTRLQSLRAAWTPQPVYIIAEKILATDEQLPVDWGLDGTSGYDFMDQVGAWLHEGHGSVALDAIWYRSCADSDVDARLFRPLVSNTRRRLLEQNFASELQALCQTLHTLARSEPATRDLSLHSIHRCVLELLVSFPVYRSYADADGCCPYDAHLIRTTATQVSERLRALDRPSLLAVVAWLSGAASAASPATKQLRWRARTRWQQLTPPLTAKSTEDTAFYRYGRLLSRNEVGSMPAQLALSSDHLHRYAAQRHYHFPDAMLSTATHDHKRGEDARARLAVLSEVPQQWGQALRQWQQINQAARAQAPIDAVDELMLYQSLIGVWPLARLDLRDVRQRLSAWQQKALREAKRRSDWNAPDLAYEAVCDAFLMQILRDAPDNDFLPALQQFLDQIAAAGALNGLSQTMLRLTMPGVPDLYQGCEFWDFSLVDPDNRRAVDYAARQAMMQHGQRQPLTLDDWRSGGCKQQLIQMLLHFRRSHSDLFNKGHYVPLTVQGSLASKLIAFARSVDTCTVVVVCSRHSAGEINAEDDLPLIEASRWGDTRVLLPTHSGKQWQSILSGAQGALTVIADGPWALPVAAVLRGFPVDLLVLSR